LEGRCERMEKMLACLIDRVRKMIEATYTQSKVV